MIVAIVTEMPIRQAQTKSGPRRNREPLATQPLLREGAEYEVDLGGSHSQSNIVVKLHRGADRALAPISDKWR